MTDQVKEEISTEIQEQVDVPKFYRVLMHNDNKTTMDFVIMILLDIFHKNEYEAETIMLKIHTEDIAVVGVYTHEIAEQKTDETLRLARQYHFPLAVTYEPE